MDRIVIVYQYQSNQRYSTQSLFYNQEEYYHILNENKYKGHGHKYGKNKI